MAVCSVSLLLSAKAEPLEYVVGVPVPMSLGLDVVSAIPTAGFPPFDISLEIDVELFFLPTAQNPPLGLNNVSLEELEPFAPIW